MIAQVPRGFVESDGKKKVWADEDLTKSADDTPYNDSEGGV